VKDDKSWLNFYRSRITLIVFMSILVFVCVYANLKLTTKMDDQVLNNHKPS